MDRLRNGLCASGERSFRPSDLTTIGGLTLTTPLRTAWDLGRLAHRDSAIGALDALLVRRAAAIAKEKGLDQRGYRTLLNCNAEAGQTVFHIHLHLLAGRHLGWPPG